MQRRRRLRTWVLLSAALVAFGSRATTAEPERPDSTWRLASVVTDPAGRATEVLDRAVEALAAQRFDEAADRLLRLHRDHPDVLVGAPASVGWEVPLLWPAARVVEAMLGTLPDAQQRRVQEAWRGPSHTLEARAQAGDERALEALAERWAATPPGSSALRALARRDLEAGHFAAAAERLERWLRLARARPRREQAAALLMLVDARAGLGDERGLGDVTERWDAIVSLGVPTARGRTTPAQRARQAGARLRLEARRTTPAASDEPTLPLDPVVLWTLDHEDPGLLGDRVERDPVHRATAGAAADGDHVILDDGACVRRIDAVTGRVSWRFPPERPGAWDYAAAERYAPHDVPVRTVTVAGDLVLVVLGDPVSSGSFTFRGGEVRTTEEARESRTRLVALDRQTGALRWTTGQADEPHPVLGDLATGCHSPPLVRDGHVYALFARRRGVSEIHLARLDLATGRPDWVVFLAAAESGRSADIDAGASRFRDEYVRTGPWGARPAYAHGEICAVPHAGFAAGLDAQTGRVRWIRVLPRFQWIDARSLTESGFSARNEPLAHAGSWILAPLDSPRIVALEQGTGRWLWSRDPEDGTPFDPWHHVLGVEHALRGGPWLKLADWVPALLPTARPMDPLVSSGYLDAYEPPGRPYDTGSRVVVLGSSPSPTPALTRAAPRPALLSLPWNRKAARRPGDVRRATLTDRRFPLSGDVYRAGRVWIVVGTRRTGAVASFEEALAWVGARQSAADLDPVAGADVTALDARLRMDVDGAVRALRDAVAVADTAGRRTALRTMRRLIDDEVRGIERLVEPLLAHAPTEAAGLLADLVLAPVLQRRPDRLIPLLDRWVEVGRDGRVVAEPKLTLRADLYAGLVLRLLRETPAAAPALRVRDERHAALVEAALTGPEGELREAIRRAVGTVAADRGRHALRARLVAAGRFAAAATVAADLRLDADADLPALPIEQRRTLATLQGEEATLLARAGEAARARRLLLDLERWAPDRPMVLADGRTARQAAKALGAATGWRVAGRPPTHARPWSEADAAPDAAELRTLVVPGLVGPGAARATDRVVVLRGLSQEVWNLGEGARLGAWPGPGRGWFGGTLQEVATWLPDGGVVVTSLVAGEPADESGLEEGDWLVRWDGKAIPDASHFMHLAASARPGVPIAVDIRRGGRRILETFVPGARPDRDGSVVRRDVLYAAADGRVLVPGRLDLAWVDPAEATRTPLWRWPGTGVLNSVAVLHGRAVVTIRRFREEDSLVAVELETGEEAWNTPIAGTVVSVEATGSSIVATTADPAAVFVLDAHDGTFRARLDVMQRRAPSISYALTFAPPAAVVHGRVWGVVSAAEGGYGLRVVNTTTGAQVYEPLADDGLQPLIAGDGVVAISTGVVSLDVIAPDPVTGHPHRRTQLVHDMELGDGNSGFRSLDANSRLHLVGDRLWITRTRFAQGLTVQVLEVDVTALGPGAREAVVPARSVFRRIGTRSVEGLASTVYLLDAKATPDGLVLSAASTSEPPRRTVTWVDVHGRTRQWPSRVGEGGGVRQVRRHSPSRVGATLVLPSDDGVTLVPLAPGG